MWEASTVLKNVDVGVDEQAHRRPKLQTAYAWVEKKKKKEATSDICGTVVVVMLVPSLG